MENQLSYSYSWVSYLVLLQDLTVSSLETEVDGMFRYRKNDENRTPTHDLQLGNLYLETQSCSSECARSGLALCSFCGP